MIGLLLVKCMLVVVYLQSACAEQICYDDLGCFSNEAPYDVFGSFPPKSPDYIGTKFLLYTRLNSNIYIKVDRSEPASLQASTFSSNRKTVFIIHGYTEKGSTSVWMKELKDNLLATENLNVFLVDWVAGARNLYGQSVQNTRVVGREIGRFAQFLNAETGASYDRMHLVGHSLGAHIAGYAGTFQPGLARISGLDPAGPYFTNTDPACRLDPNDAIFVDVIHTDAEAIGLGIVQPVGHMDFYPNGGKEQPGCPANVGEALPSPSEVSCSHVRVLDLYIDSLASSSLCHQQAYPCLSWSKFRDGRCTGCGLLGCPTMGYWATNSWATGSFYLVTTDSVPFCQL